MADRTETASERTVLVLGGTTEGYRLAEQLQALPGWTGLSSLAGRTREPRRPAGAVRIGGFGGADGLAAFLRAGGISAVIDATHPFARSMGWNAAEACRQTGVPLVRLERPAWTPGSGDHWIWVDDWSQAVGHLRTLGVRRAFLALGRQEAGAFAGLPECHLVIRAVDLPDPLPPLADAEWVLARGPFSLEEERTLLTRHAVDCIVCKNSGGAMDAKLVVARDLGLPVLLHRRPPRPKTPVVATCDAALDWLRTLSGNVS